MLSAFKPGDSIYDSKKFYIKKSMIKLKSKENIFSKKFNLPIINNTKNNISPDKFILRNTKISFNNKNINLNLFDNSQYNISNTLTYVNKNNDTINNNKNLNINKKYLLSDNILPKLKETKKIIFLMKNIKMF